MAGKKYMVHSHDNKSSGKWMDDTLRYQIKIASYRMAYLVYVLHFESSKSFSQVLFRQHNFFFSFKVIKWSGVSAF